MHKSARAIILAAGFGSRLMPYTKDRPKCMVEFLGKTLLQRQTEVFHACGITEIAIVTGHAHESVPSEGYYLFENKDYQSTNMVSSLMTARDWIISTDQDLIISYGDIIFNQSVLKALLSQENKPAYVVSDTNWQEYWAMRMDNPLDDVETFKVSDDGLIIELGKKPQDMSEVQGQYTGLQKWCGDALNQIFSLYDSMDKNAVYDTKPFPQMYMTSFVQAMINSGIEVGNVPVTNGWLEFDMVSDYKIYEEMYQQGKLKDFYDPDEF